MAWLIDDAGEGVQHSCSPARREKVELLNLASDVYLKYTYDAKFKSSSCGVLPNASVYFDATF